MRAGRGVGGAKMEFGGLRRGLYIYLSLLTCRYCGRKIGEGC
jgi:hypothetical protein